MASTLSRNIRLGVFVLAGTIFLIAILYMIGSKRSLFGSTFRISAQFYNVNGLTEGNNVRFGGIDVGTVESVKISTDSSVQVVMLIREDARQFIREDALAAVGTDGLMGNKLVSINAVKRSKAPPVKDNDVLKTLSPIETDEMLRTLNTTNDNIKYISSDLRTITQKINSRNTLWSLLMDTVVAENVKQSLVNIRITGERTATITGDLGNIVENAKHGKGLIASLFTDTTLSGKLNSTIVHLDSVSGRMATVTGDFKNVSSRINRGEGTVGMLVVDTVFAKDLKSAIKNANQGAEGFSENMEALKHSVFLRKYFRKKTKAKK